LWTLETALKKGEQIMKPSNLSKLVGAGLIATSLAVVPLTLSAQAQNTAPDTTTQQNADVDARGPISDHTERDNSNDLGWFGLIGLAGLAGLLGKKRQEVHTQQVSRDPDVQVRSGSDYR
jgi:LPXTG-motif cell wall-anchored protein